MIGCDESGRSLSEGNSPSRLGRQGSRGRYGYAVGRGYRPSQSRRVSRRDLTSVRKTETPKPLTFVQIERRPVFFPPHLQAFSLRCPVFHLKAPSLKTFAFPL